VRGGGPAHDLIRFFSGASVTPFSGLTGLSCAWFFRHMLFLGLKIFLLAGIFAFGGKVFMLVMGGYSVYTTVRDSGFGTEAPVLVSLALGISALILARIS